MNALPLPPWGALELSAIAPAEEWGSSLRAHNTLCLQHLTPWQHGKAGAPAAWGAEAQPGRRHAAEHGHGLCPAVCLIRSAEA